MSWAFKTVGFRGTPLGDLPLLVFVNDGAAADDDQAIRQRLTDAGLRPFPAEAEDLLQPASAWSAVARAGAVAVTCNGTEFYRPRPGLVPEAWTQMVVATGRVVLVWLPGASPPDDEEVLALLRRGAGLWGTAALSES
ncbi:hypothetical protein [Streptomyces virginiae]|uniref:hypothetical protein n=1 Tax=Streptomyces virginiae TaxID=1961 RepID=UPI003453042E